MKINKIFILLLIACFVSLYYKLFLFRNVDLYLSSDSAIYGSLAVRFAKGDFFHAMHLWWFPLYPFISGITYIFVSKIEYALFFVNALSSSILIIPLYLILKKITKSLLIAIAGALAASLNYTLIVSHINLLSEMTYILMLLFSVCSFFIALQSLSRKNISIAGFCFGLAFLTRSEAIFFFIPSIIFLFFYLLYRKDAFSVLFTRIILFVIAFCICISPYVIFNYLQYKSVNLSAKSNAAFKMGSPFAIDRNGRNFAQDVWSIDAPNYQSFYFLEPYRFNDHYSQLLEAGIIRIKIYVAYIVRVTNPLLLLVATIGFILLLYKSKHEKEFIYIPYIFVVGFLLTMPFLTQAENRYIYWIYPFGYLFIFTVIGYLAKFFLQGVSSKIFYLLLFLIIGGYVFMNSHVIAMTKVNEQYGSSYKKIGEIIKKQNIKEPKVMTRIEAIAFYSDGKTVYIPISINYNQLLEYAKKTKTDFIIVDKLMFLPDSKLYTLLNDKVDYPGLKRIADFHDTIKTSIYKVL